MKAIGADMGILAKRRSIYILLLFCGFSILASAFYFLLIGRVQSAALALLFFLILLSLPFIEHLLHLSVPLLGYGLLLFLLLGAMLGSCYDLYLKIPFWDTLLHALSGLLFSCFGYSFCKLLFPKQEDRRYISGVIVAISFSLSIALIWELFEAGVTLLFPVDMQEDTLVNGIKSFYLSGTHDRAAVLPEIRETVILYGNGQVLHLPGYLDLGLADTLSDMAVCLLGSLLFLLLAFLDRLLGGRIFSSLIPGIGKTTKKE